MKRHKRKLTLGGLMKKRRRTNELRRLHNEIIKKLEDHARSPIQKV